MSNHTYFDCAPFYLCQGGCLVWACIGNYEGKGEQRVILHEVDLNYDHKLFSYGHKRTWNFPVKVAK